MVDFTALHFRSQLQTFSLKIYSRGFFCGGLFFGLFLSMLHYLDFLVLHFFIMSPDTLLWFIFNTYKYIPI